MSDDTMSDDVILEMRAITKTFPGVLALKDVSLSVRSGEIHAICGENGAGKSTLMKILSGVHPHGTYDGEIAFEGKPVEFRGIRDSEHHGIVIIHQELALSPYLSIAENIFLGNERSTHGVINWNRTDAEAAKLLARVGLSERPDTKIFDIGVGPVPVDDAVRGALVAQEDVLGDRQVGAQRELLVDDHDAVVLAVPDPAELDRLALEGDLAVIGAVRVHPGENLHQGGLACPVLPADRVNLPRADRERDVLQRDDTMSDDVI